MNTTYTSKFQRYMMGSDENRAAVKWTSELIEFYTTKKDLINKIIQSYLEFLKADENSTNILLNDNQWASTGSEYHIGCRERVAIELKEIQKQIKLLS